MNIIIFVRHGQSSANVKHLLTSDIGGYPLTEEGIEQATSLMKTIPKGIRLDGFYTSPVLRTVQTAEVISRVCGIAPVKDDRLWERHMGSLNDVAFQSKQALVDAVIAEMKSGYEKGMESWDHMQDRIKSFAADAKGMSVAVTHHDVIISALGIVDEKYNDIDDLTEIEQASATTIDFEGKKIIGVSESAFPDVSRWQA